jgi:hypothetical protein
MKAVDFTSVRVDDITDSLTIRIVRVNGTEAEVAAQNGILQIKAISGDTWESYIPFKIENGVITGYNWKNASAPFINAWDELIPYGDVTIHDGITAIGDNAFSSCNLTSVIIPNSVITIGNNAFLRNKLTNVIIPNRVISIGKYAFCLNNLTSVTIPNRVTYIGRDAFVGNRLTHIDIGNNVTVEGRKDFFYPWRGAAFSYNTFPSAYEENGRKSGFYNWNSIDGKWYKAGT